MTRSAGAPDLTLAITFASIVAVTLCPVLLWNPEARSRAPEIEPCEASIVISAACAVAAKAANTPAAVTHNHRRMASSREFSSSVRHRLDVSLAHERRRLRRDHEL